MFKSGLLDWKLVCGFLVELGEWWNFVDVSGLGEKEFWNWCDVNW